MYAPLKRLFDLGFGVVLLLALAPFLLALAGLVAVKDGRPVLFRQVRIGLLERPFLLYKFRTMTSEGQTQHGEGLASPTKLGEFLRKTSLDELPSILNIIKGDLSFVGPRPLLTSYLDLYSPKHRRRHEVRPGLTGLAQVSGRNHLSWKEKLDLDIIYLEGRSISLDLKILLRTIAVVLGGTGVNQKDGHHMEGLTKGYEGEKP